jgi:hypothetical protein
MFYRPRPIRHPRGRPLLLCPGRRPVRIHRMSLRLRNNLIETRSPALFAFFDHPISTSAVFRCIFARRRNSTQVPLRSPSSDAKESLTGRTAIPQDEASHQAKIPGADKTTHISQETSSVQKPQPTADGVICSCPVYPSPSLMSSSLRPRSTLVQDANAPGP